MTGKGRILVVEHKDLLRMAVADILAVEGYEVITAADGQAALEKLQENTPDVIVAETELPNMDGYALLEALREQAAYAYIPVIFLVTPTTESEPEDAVDWHTWREDRLTCKASGASDCIPLPFDPQELVISVAANAQRYRELRALKAIP